MRRKLLAFGICVLVLLIVLNSVYLYNEKTSESFEINEDEDIKERQDRTNLTVYLSTSEIGQSNNKISQDLLQNGIPNYTYLNDTTICFLVTFTRSPENEDINYINNEYGNIAPWRKGRHFRLQYGYYYSIINLNINKLSDFLKEELVQKIENIDKPHLLDEEIDSLKEKNDIPINQGVKGTVTLATGDYFRDNGTITLENISAIIYFIHNETKNSYVAVSKDDGNYKIELPTGNYTVVYIYYNNSKEIQMYNNYPYYTSPYYYMDNIDEQHYIAYYRELFLQDYNNHYNEVTFADDDGKIVISNGTVSSHDIYIDRVTG